MWQRGRKKMNEYEDKEKIVVRGEGKGTTSVNNARATDTQFFLRIHI